MEDDTARQIEYFHMGLGLLAGTLSGVLGRNGAIIGTIIGYSGFFLTRIIFKFEKDAFPMNTWLSKGAMPFLMFWLPVWIFVFNI
jgi:hypothetical protein